MFIALSGTCIQKFSNRHAPFLFYPILVRRSHFDPQTISFLRSSSWKKKKYIYIYIYLILGVHPKKKTFSQLGLSVSLQIWDERAKR